MTDTSPEIAEMVRVQLMAKSGAERFRMGVEMFESARRMVLASLPADLSDAERKSRLFERLYGEALPTQTDEGQSRLSQRTIFIEPRQNCCACIFPTEWTRLECKKKKRLRHNGPLSLQILVPKTMACCAVSAKSLLTRS